MTTSHQPGAIITPYQLEVCDALGRRKFGVGCQININESSCVRISVFNHDDIIGHLKFILREQGYSESKFLGYIFYLPNGLPIEYMVDSSNYSMRLEKYLDKYVTIVVYTKGTRDVCYIPFEPIIVTKTTKAN